MIIVYNFRIYFAILLVTLSSFSVYGQDDDKEWTHNLSLDRGVELRWNSNDPEWLTMEMSAPVTGYVSVGFSPNGAMKGSDIVMGWVDSFGEPYILDMHAVGNQSPLVDAKQDYVLISGEEDNGRTTIRFKRKWNTCDENDMKLGADSSRVIWAIHSEDPLEKKPKYHGEHRGVRRTFVRSKVHHSKFPDQTNDDPSIKHWDVRMDENVIDAEDDIYFCKIAKFPKMDAKQHLIGYRPLLQKGNEFSIHHIILYECKVPGTDGGTETTFEQYVTQKGGRCYTPNMPPEWGTYCTTIPIIWTSGSEGNMFPSNVGSPLGEEHGGTTFFMFEVHYDNPQLKSFVDSSGFRLFYTENLRENDASSMLIGTKVSPFHVVPPKMQSFTTLGYCTSECTAQTIPPEGVTITTVLLHAHTSGKKITLRHIRDGQELPPIAQENHYDYDYQQARVVEPNRKILPGDELITECEYETTKKTKPTFGGLGTRDEMCMSFVYYYPKIELEECKTQQEFHSFLEAIGVEKVEGDILTEINMPYTPKDGQTVDYPDSPQYLANSTYQAPLNALDAMVISDTNAMYSTVADLIYDGIDWENDGKSVEKQWLQGKQYAFCTGGVKKRIPLTDYIVNFPKYKKYVKPADTECSAKIPETSYLPPQGSSQNKPVPQARPPPRSQQPANRPQTNTKSIAIYTVPVPNSNSGRNPVYVNYRPPQTSSLPKNGRKSTNYGPPQNTRQYYQQHYYRAAAPVAQYPARRQYQPSYQVQRSPLYQQRYANRGFYQSGW